MTPKKPDSTELSLPTHHFVWLFDAASDHFQEEIEELELEIIRHRAFIDKPIESARPGPTTNRATRISECEARIVEYKGILDFSRRCSERFQQASAQEFAKAFTEYLKSKDL